MENSKPTSLLCLKGVQFYFSTKKSMLRGNKVLTQRKPILATRVSPVVNKSVKQLAKILGITVSEYLRKLILDDLESKQMLSKQFTKTVEQTEPKQNKERPEDKIRKLLSRLQEEESDEGIW
jgi:transcriptional regulator with XRE-family HTH domain